MKKDKELAKECFDHYLKENFRLLDRNWTPAEGPPDYYLEAGPRRLAVQVGVLEGKSDTAGAAFFEGGPEPFDASDRERQLAERIGSAADAGGMRGTYGIALRSPHGGFSDAIQQEIEDKALDYIEKTQQAAVLLPGRVYDDDGMLVASIKKRSDRPHSVEVVRFPPLNSFLYEERGDEAGAAVRRAFFGAQCVLSESARADTWPPVVLLLLDTWLHGTRGIYQSFMSVSGLREYWQSIFVVEEALRGYFPLNEHKDWWMRLAGMYEVPQYDPEGPRRGGPVWELSCLAR